MGITTTQAIQITHECMIVGKPLNQTMCLMLHHQTRAEVEVDDVHECMTL
jgi:hypothetical protein